ncbi:class I adenylate-forming enzyme family protein [Coraliomargarita sp. W4R72]
MYHSLEDHWAQVLRERGDSVALLDAESGETWSFQQLNDQACAWRAANESLCEVEGQVWCLALSDRVAWLTVFLAAIQSQAVLLPLEPSVIDSLRNQATAQGANYLIHDEGVQSLSDACPRPGVFLIKLTSGTTGSAKALPFTESEMMADGRQIMRTMSLTPQDRNYVILPLGHSYGLGNLVMPFFMAGVPMVLGSSPFPQVMLEEMAQFPCTVLPLVPPLVKALSMVSLESKPLPRLRLVISAGSALKVKFAKLFYANTGLRVHNFYGSSETGGICFDRSGELSEVDGALGTAMSGVELSIGEDQSIHVRSEAVCHAVYHAGVCPLHDFGRLDEMGTLHLLGRHSDVVKIAGRRVSLSEIETALCALDGVADAYVSSRVGRSDELRCVALYAGSVEADAVRCLLKSNLPAWKVPKHLWRIDSIPYTSRGKKDRGALEDLIERKLGN